VNIKENGVTKVTGTYSSAGDASVLETALQAVYVGAEVSTQYTGPTFD
jgi:hypothetical protein